MGVGITTWEWEGTGIKKKLIPQHLYHKQDAGQSIQCKLTSAARSPSIEIYFCTLWPCDHDLWPLDLILNGWPSLMMYYTLASLVIVVSAVLVLACGHTDRCTDRRGWTLCSRDSHRLGMSKGRRIRECLPFKILNMTDRQIQTLLASRNWLST